MSVAVQSSLSELSEYELSRLERIKENQKIVEVMYIGHLVQVFLPERYNDVHTLSWHTILTLCILLGVVGGRLSLVPSGNSSSSCVGGDSYTHDDEPIHD